MRYVERPLQRLARGLGRSPHEVNVAPTDVHGVEPAEAQIASEYLAVNEATCEFLEVIDEHLEILLDHVEVVIRDLESRYGYVRLEMVVAATHKRARGLGADGEALKGLAGHLDSMRGAAGNLFDLAVEEEESPLGLIERALGY